MAAIAFKEGQQVHGYQGKIARLNLTDGTVEIVPTLKYAPRFIGGRAVCNAIFWDDIKGCVGAFDPENELIMMSGATAGSGLPCSGRMEVTGVSPNSHPEQYTHSNMGGYFSTMLKWAGWDGLIICGKAPHHTYIHIENDEIEFLDADADGLWGLSVHDTQNAICGKYGRETHSIVCGPAGENLCRNATLTNGGDSASAMAGFGAVFGSKNLKAICVHGTGMIQPAHLDQVLELRNTVGNPPMAPNPLRYSHPFASTDIHAATEKVTADDPDALKVARLDCCQGCSATCMNTVFDVKSAYYPGKRVTQVSKCVDLMLGDYRKDIPWKMAKNVYSHHELTRENYQYNQIPPEPEGGSPDRVITTQSYPGDEMDLWSPVTERYTMVAQLCNEYGLDKWDVTVWYLTWLSMCEKEDLFDGHIDFGMKVDLDDMDFIRHFLKILVYREGPDITLVDGTVRPIGDVMAEGMARAIRLLGKERYGDSEYHGRKNSVTGKPLRLPVSLESGWGHCSHYQGRGFENTRKFNWLAYSIVCMRDTRDTVGSNHMHDWMENYLQYADDPCHSPRFAKSLVENDIAGEIKESLVCCEWKSPNIAWPEMEAEMYVAATGLDDVTRVDLEDMARASKLVYRSILIRNYGRTRDMEVEEMFPFITYPDPWGEKVDWDEWNDLVDLYYQESGWDLATGWPLRSTYEACGLSELADEMEQLGLLPPDGGTKGYVRKTCPFKMDEDGVVVGRLD